MSFNGYLDGLLAAEHQRDLRQEAAADRLAQQLLQGRSPWWRRLAGPAGSAPARRRRGPVLHQHPVTH